MADPSGRPLSSGVARRRRERRLRSMLRHERMSVAMALAEVSHHTAPRSQRTARAGVWGHEQNYTANIRKPPHTSASKKSQAGACQHLSLRSLAGRARWSGTSWRILASKTLRTPCGSWISRWPSRLSKCRRSLAHRVLLVLVFLSRR